MFTRSNYLLLDIYGKVRFSLSDFIRPFSVRLPKNDKYNIQALSWAINHHATQYLVWQDDRLQSSVTRASPFGKLSKAVLNGVLDISPLDK